MDDRFGAATYAKCAHFNSFLEKHSRFRRECYATGFGSSLKSMRQIQCDIRKEAQTIIDQYKAANRDPTDREDARLDELHAVLSDLDGAIDSRVGDMERERNQPIVSRASNTFDGDYSHSQVLPAKAGGRRMAELFAGHRLTSDGFQSFKDYWNVLQSDRYDNRLQAAVSEGRDSFGSGFLIPGRYVADLLDSSLEQEVVRSRGDVIATDTNEITTGVWDTENRSANVGGLDGVWMGQTEEAPVQNAKWRGLRMVCKKLAIFVECSNELAADGDQFERRLSTAMTQAMGFHLDDGFINGTGAGQPLGILNANSLITVAKESGQTADTVTYNNVVGMYARMAPQSITRAVWLASPTVTPQLLRLFAVNASATVGGHVPTLREDGTGAFSLLGRPVVISEKMRTLGDVGDLLFVDLSQYLIAIRLAAAIEKSQHYGWQRDTTSFRIKVRVDGRPKWSQAVTPVRGDTLSWAIVLGERA